MDSMLCIGEIVKPQGIKGEVKVAPLTDNPERFGRLKECEIELGGKRGSFSVEAVRLAKDCVYVKFSGVNDRNKAEGFRGGRVLVSRENAVELEEGRYFIVDLLGCEVFCSDGRLLGTLDDVLQHGAADVYVVKGERPFMVPALKALLERVDIEHKRVVLNADVLGEVAVYDED